MKYENLESENNEASKTTEEKINNIFNEIHAGKLPSMLETEIKGTAARIGFTHFSDPDYAREQLEKLSRYLNDFPIKKLDDEEVLKKLSIQAYIDYQIKLLEKAA